VEGSAGWRQYVDWSALCARAVTSRSHWLAATISSCLHPFLFEACSGRLELRHCAQPIRAALRRASFIEVTVHSVDVDGSIVRALAADGTAYNLPYDHLVVALGASTNERWT